MTRRFEQVQPEERVTLAALRQQGESLRRIGLRLGRSAATLSRKLRRNEVGGSYGSMLAQRAGACLEFRVRGIA